MTTLKPEDIIGAWVSSEVATILSALSAVDTADLDYLASQLSDGGRGRFWNGVIEKIRPVFADEIGKRSFPMTSPSPKDGKMDGGHSAGPWAINPLRAQVDAWQNGNPLTVCQMLWPTDERSEAETEANARLIAAAPDLLAAAEELIGYIGAGDPNDSPEIARVFALRAAIHRARSTDGGK